MLTRLWMLLAIAVPFLLQAEPPTASAVRIATVSLLEDNYAYILRWDDNAILIDPSEDERVWDYLTQEGLKLRYIMNTHHHWDHVAGNEKLKAWSGCEVIGPDDKRIPCLTQAVKGGQELSLDGIPVQVLFVPGHTSTHLAYYFPKQKACFIGDVLFGAGCGKILEGTVADMLRSFETIKALPETTQLFWGHEYTLNNLRFAQALEPKNEIISQRFRRVQQQRTEGIPSVPSLLAEEKKTNPFLRLDDEKFKQEIGMVNGKPEQIFERLILLKQRSVPPVQSGGWFSRAKSTNDAK